MKKTFRAGSFILTVCILLNLIIFSNSLIVSSEPANVEISSVTIEDVYFPPGEHKLAAFNAKACANDGTNEASGSMNCDIIVAAYAGNILTNAVIMDNQVIEYNRRTETSGNGNVLIGDGNNYISVNMEFSEDADSYRIFLFKSIDGMTPTAAIDKTSIPEITAIPEKETPVIYMAGDSTVCDYEDSYFPRAGWGQVLGNYFTDGSVTIDNQAKAGASSRSFRTQSVYSPFYQNIVNNIRTGDFLFIQFGHNDMWSDQPENDKYVRRNDFAHELFEYYINMARDKGAYPVLISSMVRYRWDGDSLDNNNAPYAATMKKFANAYGIPFIDLNAYSAEHLNSVGKTWSQDLYMHLVPGDLRFADDSRFATSSYYSNGSVDSVHFNYYGSNIWAKYIAESIKVSDLYIAKDIDTSYTCANPGDNFRAGSTSISINGTENFEGASPNFTKTATDGGAVEVVANPDTTGINASANVLKITPDTSMTLSKHTAIISPGTTTVALPPRYLDMSKYSKYTLEFDLYLETAEDSSRNWGTTTGNKANHYLINLQNSNGSAIGAAFVLASSEANNINTTDFKFGPRVDQNTAAPDYKITGASKGEWHKIKVEYLPDTVNYLNTKINLYLDGAFCGASTNYFGKPAAPNIGMARLFISGFMRNTIVLYVDNVTIIAQ